MPRKTRKGYYVNGEFVVAGSESDREFRDELQDQRDRSRTAKKRASEALQLLGEKLVASPDAAVAGLPLPDELHEAIREARTIKSFGARRRQLQLVGKLMRRLDDASVAAVRAALSSEGHRRK